jgi:hypothetical protein
MTGAEALGAPPDRYAILFVSNKLVSRPIDETPAGFCEFETLTFATPEAARYYAETKCAAAKGGFKWSVVRLRPTLGWVFKGEWNDA